MSAENQEQLKEITSLLSKDIITSVHDADQIRDIIELIDQEIPPTLKASLESVSNLNDYFATVRRASKNIASGAALQHDALEKEKQVQELHSQIQSAEDSLASLTPELEVMEKKKAELETQLAQLNAKIQSHKDKIAGLPDSFKSSKIMITSVIKEHQQMKTRLSKIQGSEDSDQKVRDDVSRIRSDAIDVIKSCLNEPSGL